MFLNGRLVSFSIYIKDEEKFMYYNRNLYDLFYNEIHINTNIQREGRE